MKKSAKIILKLVVFLLIVLWIYTASSKLVAYNDFRVQMLVQALPYWLKTNLSWSLPSIELLTAVLLIFKRSEFIGLMCSLVLLILFTGYVALAVAGYFKDIPCSCGGVLRSMGWKTHLLFNLFFLLLTCIGIYLFNRERRVEFPEK